MSQASDSRSAECREVRPHPDFDAFAQTIAALRAPDGCPWDREQTHRSIAHNMIEEAYEAVDAIEAGEAAHLCEELGDVLLQVVLQAQIAADAGEFTIDDVCRGINEKMIRRHPHVFGEAAAQTADEVQDIWSQVKLAERARHEDAGARSDGGAHGGNVAQQPKGLLEGVPTSFPALMQAQKISRKAVAVGFEWPSKDAVWDQVASEVEEFKEACEALRAARGADRAAGVSSSPATEAAAAAAELEFGDILFALVNVARWEHVDAENALRATCAKFRRRWSFMEGAAWAQGRAIEELTQPELEALWQAAKRRESQ